MTYEQWIQFTFNAPPSAVNMRTSTYPGPPQELLSHCLKFFKSASLVAARLPRDVLSFGLGIFPGVDGNLGILNCDELLLTERFKLVNAHEDLFSQLFLRDDFEGAAFMWFERILSSEWENARGRIKLFENRAVCDQLLIVLGKILLMESDVCQTAALHGLHHIGEYGDYDLAMTLVKQNIAAGVIRTPDVMQYAESVLSGDAR